MGRNGWPARRPGKSRRDAGLVAVVSRAPGTDKDAVVLVFAEACTQAIDRAKGPDRYDDW
ncbi:hypothetical protein TPA0598_07_08060 [Streptomyces lydicamycinicus]|uniref:Uncharacterized protein n=1 Tax=Streptomyces lydicamycinicus TaxID=1546107 RepID=A0A0P4RBY5_9ACTN|nr:hypothetical protein TPA0598_07_08060 [Streptomyces lydicamycinicus]